LRFEAAGVTKIKISPGTPIICWNYLYLSQQILEAETAEQKAELIAAIKNGSVVSWRHINLHGEYDFSDEKLQDSVGLDLTQIVGLKLG
jgi:hypothetical protein